MYPTLGWLNCIIWLNLVLLTILVFCAVTVVFYPRELIVLTDSVLRFLQQRGGYYMKG